MAIEGGCYCGAVRYSAGGDPLFKAQCHCRECQYVSGGNPNVTMGVAEASFTYTKGKPREFRRSDLENGVTREFCAECGTQLASRAPGLPGTVMLKVGTLDDPGVFGKPDMAIYTVDRQPFHHVPEGIAVFERTPN